MFKRIRVLFFLVLSLHSPLSSAGAIVPIIFPPIPPGPLPLAPAQPTETFVYSSSFFQAYNDFIQSMAAAIQAGLFGAHSRPLSHLVGENEKTVWVSGDWGRDDHGPRSGSIGLAEINYGYNFGSFQLNGTLGQTWANQSGANNSDLDADGQYVMLEGIFPVSKEHKLFAVVSVLGHQGEADIRRGYVTGITRSASNASPDTDTYALRARLEWQNASEFLGTQISPYGDLSYTKSHTEAYRETGGTAPLKFDALSDDNTTLRIGFNAERPIAGSQLNWVGNLEAAHSFDSSFSNLSGQNLLGGPVTLFNFSGGKIHNNWVKAGVGVEGLVGQGKATLMLNGTSNGAMPNMWVAASYQLIF